MTPVSDSIEASLLRLQRRQHWQRVWSVVFVLALGGLALWALWSLIGEAVSLGWPT